LELDGTWCTLAAQGKHIYEWVNIPGSNSPEFFASAEYVGKSIRVRVTPISKDGIKGITDTVKVCRWPPDIHYYFC
jgi:hypothetical protein